MDHESLFWGLIQARLKNGQVVNEAVIESCMRQALELGRWAKQAFARLEAEQAATRNAEKTPDAKKTDGKKP